MGLRCGGLRGARQGAGRPLRDPVHDRGDDQSFQNTKVENLLAQGIKAIAVVPFDEKAVQPIIDAAHSVGAKYIGCTTPSADFILRRNNESVGATFATGRPSSSPPKGNYVPVHGEQGNDVAEAKKRGIWSVIQPLVDSGDIEIVSEQYTKGWDPQLAQARGRGARPRPAATSRRSSPRTTAWASACTPRSRRPASTRTCSTR
ncbi:MAG: substrate-binding domain-containing protein [Chloroflexota bacterium]